jgi:hypothetical protein
MGDNTVGFDGNPGDGANINLNVPLPGALTGHRLIAISDIDASAWSDAAYDAGTDVGSDSGITEEDDGDWVVDTGRFLDSWFNSAQEQTIEDRTELEFVRDYFGTLIKEHIADPSWRIESELPYLETGRIPLPQPIPQESLSAYNTEWFNQMIAAKHVGEMGRSARVWDPDLRVGLMSSSRIASQRSARVSEIAGLFKKSLSRLSDGIVYLPAASITGRLVVKPVRLASRRSPSANPTKALSSASAEPGPTLLMRQTIGVSSFLGDYGLGKTLKTFTLLPGEEMTISSRTWRSSTTTQTEAYSMIDSAESSAQERFTDSVYEETTDEATKSKTEYWDAEAQAKGSMGFASASVTASGGGEYSSDTSEFSKSVDEAVSEHAAESSSYRENTVTSSSESTQSSEDESVVERTIKNINVGRVLNFTFRELNQRYLVKTHLKDIHIAFTNGNIGSWREVPLSGLRTLLDEVLKDDSGSGGTNWPEKVAVQILNTMAIVFDLDDNPITVLSSVRSDDCGETWTIRESAKRTVETGGPCKDFEAPTPDRSLFYRFRRNDEHNGSDEDGVLGQEDEEIKVPGVLLRQREVTLATDSVVVEALLGSQDALDEYSKDLQVETIREKQLANDQAELGQTIVRDGDTVKADLYAKIFGLEAEEV